MQKYVFLLIFIFCLTLLTAQVKEIGSLLVDGVPDIPQKIVERMNQYQNVRLASFVDWNPFGPGMLIATRFGETSQIHYVEWPGGARQQLTFFKEPVSSALYCPDPERKGFLFEMDTGGGEFYQLYFFDLNTSQPILLTDGKSRNTDPIWSNDGKSVIFSSNLRNGKDMDIREVSLTEPGVSEMILQTDGLWITLDWSKDESKLLLVKYVSINEAYLFSLDIATKTLIQLNAQNRKIAYGGARWSADGKGVYYTSDEMGEFQELIYYEVATGARKRLTSHIPWDIDSFTLSQDRKKLAYVSNEDGISKLHVISLCDMKEVQIPQPPISVLDNVQFSPDGTEIAMTVRAPHIPGDVYVIRLLTGELIRWTFSEAGGLKSENFIAPELIHYPTFDQVDGKPRQIPAFYYKPRNIQGKAPVLISIHGGPEAQELPTFSSFYQYTLSELGIAILCPNVRGSSGYGKTYLTLDNGFLRMDSIKDLGALLDWVAKQPELDADRVCLFGGSYGGYMVLSGMAYYNDKLRAGIDIVGISNLVTFLESTQEYRRDLRRAEYGDERDPEMRKFLIEIAPITNAHKMKKPLLVVQGQNDPRVPIGEAAQIVKTVRENGGQVWYIVGTNEGHGFRKKSNRDYFLNATMLFLENFLLK